MMKTLMTILAGACVFFFGQVAWSQPGIDAPEQANAEFQATNLNVDARCSATEPGKHIAVFTWDQAKRAERTRIDVTQFYSGFRSERFETIATLDGSRNSFEWSGGVPTISYQWRVLTYSGGRWNSSEIAHYLVRACPVDYLRPDKRQR
jgi:hypothetical protein